MNTLRIPTNYIHLENRDQQLLQIENLIDAKRKMLIDKQKKFKNLTKQNEFLNEVKQDYNKYYGYIVKQKEDQMSALSLLNTYIKDLTNISILLHAGPYTSELINQLKMLNSEIDIKIF